MLSTWPCHNLSPSTGIINRYNEPASVARIRCSSESSHRNREGVGRTAVGKTMRIGGIELESEMSSTINPPCMTRRRIVPVFEVDRIELHTAWSIGRSLSCTLAGEDAFWRVVCTTKEYGDVEVKGDM